MLVHLFPKYFEILFLRSVLGSIDQEKSGQIMSIGLLIQLCQINFLIYQSVDGLSKTVTNQLTELQASMNTLNRAKERNNRLLNDILAGDDLRH